MVRKVFAVASIVLVGGILVAAFFWPSVLWALVVVLPLVGLGVYDMVQRRHTIRRIYPVVGHLRYLFEAIRPEIQQYFVESETNGMPVSREFRALVYQRAKGVRDTRPFGTVFDVYRDGYEWINHSLSPQPVHEDHPRIMFGAETCRQPYAASPLNISAMSFGALSRNAILALNKGARIGNFSHNTGEGGLSPYHREHGGDLVWQVGTGYFGCRDEDGQFDEALFAETANLDAVKMIEIKLSQGAKPGHGGILPAVKLTPEIAAIRKVPMGKPVISPPAHTAFTSPLGLLEFVARLRELSGGKPVGFKLCVGDKAEFLSICKAMLESGLTPDFITVDGGEGGTGAAPIELTNSVGMPVRDGLIFVRNALVGTGLRDRMRIIAAGKSISAFHMVRLIALGADTVNSARAMMFALGCIQSRHCHMDVCPTGVATQNPARYEALDVDEKAERIARYHKATITNLVELIGAAGLRSTEDLEPFHMNRRVSGTNVKNYAELYPDIRDRCLLEPDLPASWKDDWSRARPDRW